MSIEDIEFLILTGDKCLESGENVAALGFYARAVQAQPEVAEHWFRVAKGLVSQRQFEQALVMLVKGHEVDRDAPYDYDTLERIWQAFLSGEAMADVKSLVFLATAFSQINHDALALEIYNKAETFMENSAAVTLGQASALLKLDRIEEGYLKVERARELYLHKIHSEEDVEFGKILHVKGCLLWRLKRCDEAGECFEKAIALGDEKAKDGRLYLRSFRGDIEGAWEDYENREIKVEAHAMCKARFPAWEGPGSSARRVLVLSEQAQGDLIQFGRYLPLMKKVGAEPYLMYFERMSRLISPLVEGRFIALEQGLPDIDFDAYVPLGSLPYLFKTRRDTIPLDIPYLYAESDLVTQWANVVGNKGFRIGCVWQGKTCHGADRQRSFPLQEFAQLASIPGVRLISLQHGEGSEQLDDVDFPIHNLPTEFDSGKNSFVDTAAVMMSLDLIITCDTSVAHLAGALGRPVWVALQTFPDWRWLTERDTSPWYPAMRLFRQPLKAGWAPVFQEMAIALRKMCHVA